MKAQMTAEMMAVFAGMLIVFAVCILVFNGQRPGIAQAEERMEAARVAHALGSAINYVFFAGNGTSAKLTVISEGANATINDRFINVRIGNAYADFRLVSNRTNNTGVPLGDMMIRNLEGVVYIENA